jgi:hypothetical protein
MWRGMWGGMGKGVVGVAYNDRGMWWWLWVGKRNMELAKNKDKPDKIEKTKTNKDKHIDLVTVTDMYIFFCFLC